ncbi:MAG: hypothetical protein IPL96_05655 [Holophagaceae bacterium]|nr:hypothetical protein [Holophagaceae bacterium]
MYQVVCIICVILSGAVAHAQALRECIVFKEENATKIKSILDRNPKLKSHTQTLETIENESKQFESILVVLHDLKSSYKSSENGKFSYEDQQYIPYLFAWQLAINRMRSFKNVDYKLKILDQWDKWLMEDKNLTTIQVFALMQEWNPEFLTEKFWEILGKTPSKSLLNSMLYVLRYHGNELDCQRLLSIYSKESDKRRGFQVGITVSWIQHRLHGKPGDTGPSTMGPILE